MSKVEVLVAMAMISVVTLACLLQGFDGNVAYLAVVAIAGLGGYQIREEAKSAS